ncbi:cupin domain-containing protein [Ferrovibrio sp.]|uniref:cupin domain-containing protein n=1 Tax=Ferrovibrio sp. TaxID=1917215 RepID=UPI003D0B099B
MLNTPSRGLIIQREEAQSWWQPAPSHGCMNTILTPENCPSNTFTVATQYIDEGCVIRHHAHDAAEEILFLYEGEGTLHLNGQDFEVGPGATCLVGRYTLHALLNKSPGTMKVLAVLFPPCAEITWRGMGRPRVWGEPPPPRYGREQIPDMKDLLVQGRFADPARITSAKPEERGAAICMQPDEGVSYWQPQPTGGFVTWKLWHDTMTSNMFAMGTQSIPPGGVMPARSFGRAEGVFFVYRGEGIATVDGETRPIGPETTVYAGRNAVHSLANTGKEPLEFVWINTPPGPEQTTRLLGKPRRHGEAAPAPFEHEAGWERAWAWAGQTPG